MARDVWSLSQALAWVVLRLGLSRQLWLRWGAWSRSLG